MDEVSIHASADRSTLSLVLMASEVSPGLEANLAALAGQALPGDEVLLLGDGSNVPAGLPLRVLPWPGGGWAQAATLAREQAQGQVLVFLEPDSLPSPSLLDDLRLAFADQSLSGVAGLARGRAEGGLLAILAELEADWQAEHSPWPTGQCLALRRAALRSVLEPGLTPDQLWRALEQEGHNLRHEPDILVDIPLPETWGGLWRRARRQGGRLLLPGGLRRDRAGLQMLLSLLAPGLFLGFWTWSPDRAVTLGLLCLLLLYPLNRGFINFVASEEPGALWPALAYCLLRPWAWLSGLLPAIRRPRGGRTAGALHNQ